MRLLPGPCMTESDGLRFTLNLWKGRKMRERLMRFLNRRQIDRLERAQRRSFARYPVVEAFLQEAERTIAILERPRVV
jgi:hypothetical protein